MELIRRLDNLPGHFRGAAVSIGNFDGMHRGHALIARRLVAMAHRLGGPAVAFTFDPHPARILRPQQAPTPLSWIERKAELLGQLGVDAVLAYPTDEEFLRLEARDFFHHIVLGRLAARGIVEGRSFFFGHDRSGTTDVLGQLCAEAGIPLEVVDPLEVAGGPVSSSRVRRLVAEGRMDEVLAMLTGPYRIRGVVVRGAGRGSRLGYPTANMEQIDTLLPGEGIYAGRAWISRSRSPSETSRSQSPSGTVLGPARQAGPTAQPEPAVRPAAISIGSNPTFHEGRLKVEAFLLDFQGDLYDQPIEVDFLMRLRDIREFGSAEELVAQMACDVEATRAIEQREGRQETGDRRTEDKQFTLL